MALKMEYFPLSLSLPLFLVFLIGGGKKWWGREREKRKETLENEENEMWRGRVKKKKFRTIEKGKVRVEEEEGGE